MGLRALMGLRGLRPAGGGGGERSRSRLAVL